MRHMLILLAVLCALGGCTLQDNGFEPLTRGTTLRQTTRGRILSVSSVRDSILYTFSVSRVSLGIHDTLAATLTLNNESSATDTLMLGEVAPSLTGFWWLTNSNGDTVMSQPRLLTSVPAIRVLLGSHHSLSEWVVYRSLENPSGAPLRPGYYTLHEHFDGLYFALDIVVIP